jgi:hypothetical protein
VDLGVRRWQYTWQDCRTRRFISRILRLLCCDEISVDEMVDSVEFSGEVRNVYNMSARKLTRREYFRDIGLIWSVILNFKYYRNRMDSSEHGNALLCSKKATDFVH